jgi:uncharacterized protein
MQSPSRMTDFQSLDRNHLKLMILVVAFILVLIVIAAGVESSEFMIVAIIGCFILPLLVWASWIYPGLAYRHTSWRLSDDGLEIRRGVWWRHQIIVPQSRIQHSDIGQGPLQRGMNICTMIVYTAGTKHSFVRLEGLTHETAQHLRDTLVTAVAHPRAIVEATVPVAEVHDVES